MIEPAPIEVEEKRLTALNSYNVLDTLPEKEYDAITRLASYICQVPIALISLIDSDRQWFKSKVGLTANETPKVYAFCNHTILNDEILEIQDTFEDEVFKDNLLVKGDINIRFYAGAPLIDPDGYRLGSLCVIDIVPRKLTAEQRDALRTLADEIMSHLTLRKQKKGLQQNLERHKEFHNLFDNSSEIHCITDRDFRIQLINKSVTSTLGYTPQELLDQPIWNFFSEESRRESLNVLKNGLSKQQRKFEIETHVLTKQGDIKWISWSLTFKADKWYASGRDISDQKKILAELEQLSLVANKMVNGVVISNAADEVIWINPALEKITGYSFSELKNKRLREVVIENHKENPVIKELDELMLKKQSYEVDLIITKKGGTPLWVSIINSVIYDQAGNVDKYIRLIIDISLRKKTEHELEILSFAARKSPSGIMIRDANGKMMWMNEAQEKLIGYTYEELKNKTLGTLLIGEDTDLNTVSNAEKAVAKNESYEFEIKLYKKDKTPIWVHISNSPLFNERGELERQIGVMVDVTERKNSEGQLTLLSLVASSTTSGVIIKDSKREVEWVNNAFENITGYSLSDVKNKHLGDVLTGELTDVSIIQKTREFSKNKQSFEVDLLIYRKDGQPLWISLLNSVILDSTGKVDKYIEVIIDITLKKRAEMELIAAKEEALQLNRAKDMFISVMSHEIRTPLNAVIGMSHLLLEGNPLDSQKENLSILKFSAENLMTLINDVLDFTKIETGNIELEKADVDLRELVLSITNSMQYKASEKRIYLKQFIDENIPGTVIGDRTRLCQILLNLVGNAVKFTNEGGITIDLKVIEQTNDKVRIRFAVSDTGIGIANSKLNTIFESFKQAEIDTTRNYGGTGLGLAISKRLIELHESRINVDSVQEQGSTFWFSITFNKANNQTTNKNKEVESELNINVLVVDDNQINRLLVNKILKKWGAIVDFAENGQEAVDKIESSQQYDVVLMDIHMPVMGGLEATQIIRTKAESYFQQLPIIALTASMMNSEINQITNAGMNDYILKPFEPKLLYDKLQRYQK